MSRILVVDDEPVIRRELKRALARESFEVVEASDVAEAEAAGLGSFDLILTDLRLPGRDGDVLIERAHPIPVVVMTAHGSVPSAVDAMKRGAVDYLAKPFDPDELLLIVRRILKRPSAPSSADPSTDDGILGGSPAMDGLRNVLRKLARSHRGVLILGESGTGKELVARALHLHSPRASGPFVPVNCAAIPEGLVESELFGHERGAFTGAVSSRGGLVRSADGGTLFLDEIGELALPTQARLLRFVQEHEVRSVGSNQTQHVDVRLLAATHRDLAAMVRQGTFRQDLYYRLRVLELRVPPLRERGNDAVELATAFLARECDRIARPRMTFSESAVEAIRAHPWEGNVRELEYAIERAATLAESDMLTPEDLGLVATPPAQAVVPRAEDASLEGYFRRFVQENQGAMSETQLAERLGISRKTLWARRQKYGIPRPKHD